LGGGTGFVEREEEQKEGGDFPDQQRKKTGEKRQRWRLGWGAKKNPWGGKEASC